MKNKISSLDNKASYTIIISYQYLYKLLQTNSLFKLSVKIAYISQKYIDFA